MRQVNSTWDDWNKKYNSFLPGPSSEGPGHSFSSVQSSFLGNTEKFLAIVLRIFFIRQQGWLLSLDDLAVYLDKIRKIEELYVEIIFTRLECETFYLTI